MIAHFNSTKEGRLLNGGLNLLMLFGYINLPSALFSNVCLVNVFIFLEYKVLKAYTVVLHHNCWLCHWHQFIVFACETSVYVECNLLLEYTHYTPREGMLSEEKFKRSNAIFHYDSIIVKEYTFLTLLWRSEASVYLFVTFRTERETKLEYSFFMVAPALGLVRMVFFIWKMK